MSFHGCSRKLAAAEDAKASIESDIHPTSAVVPAQLDITDDGRQLHQCGPAIVEHLKSKSLAGLDVLVNNAAVITHLFQEVYAVNVFETVAVTESVRPLLNRGGTIVDVSSAIRSLALLLKTPGIPGMPEYSSSKTALNNLTVQWAIEEQKNGSGTRVVSIYPGAFSASSSASKTWVLVNSGNMIKSEGIKVPEK
ncbi:hypothetical protein DFH08DRAFT_1019000 [Mycena albidolilacea]|uniref:NAD(P)-binding protein n=1 Tax=Mycena albidolilacea TaxID=1033008 RepID=A0AAD6ZQM7_9AGAR|nr:hypothetical protein DFH08DRAFT_1019000 [Mycena albidolilacea]